MFRAEEKRIRWYLDRGLAEKILDNPPTIRLLFEPKGRGHEGDSFYLAGRKNVCVVCGSSEELTMHHILPRCYFKFFPEYLKSHCSYDLMPLCGEHHAKYERVAWNRKGEIAEQYDAPFHDIDYIKRNQEGGDFYAWKMANALDKYSDEIPEHRKEEMRTVILNFLNKEGDLTQEDMDKVLSFERPRQERDRKSPHGRKVMDQIPESDLDDFAIEWREHFLSTMKPRFLPENWDPKRRVYTELSNDVGRKEEKEASERVHEAQGGEAVDH
jgi:hypothetical protein